MKNGDENVTLTLWVTIIELVQEKKIKWSKFYFVESAFLLTNLTSLLIKKIISMVEDFPSA